MSEHIFLPEMKMESVQLLVNHKEWLLTWLGDAEREIDKGIVSSSICLQGLISEIVIYKRPRTDWLGIMSEYLTDSAGIPIAYSEKYGRRLHKFNQWLQSPVHAIHARWWVEKTCKSPSEVEGRYGKAIENLIQENGWIYNPKVSETQVKTRMKSELMMSFAMGTEILNFFGLLSKFKTLLQSTLSSAPMSGFLSAEYFRLRALEALGARELMPTGLDDLPSSCESGKGYCDFSIASKVDDYMGTAKRTARDKPIHSPLACLHTFYISSFCKEAAKKAALNKLQSFGNHLQSHPFDIPAFRMRDIDFPFGTDLSPLEIIGGSFIASLANKR